MLLHKYNHASFSYKLGTDLFESNLIWMNGPFKEGERNDKGNFVHMGFYNQLKDIRIKAVSDKIYGRYQDTVTTYNAFDKDDVAKFKT